MGIIVVQFMEQSLLQRNMPPASAIHDALLRVAPTSVRTPSGMSAGWIGPAPRITRTGSPLTPLNTYNTHVVWLYRVPDSETAESGFDSNRFYAAVMGALARLTPQHPEAHYQFLGLSLSDYNEEVNGPLDSWESGLAASTTTRDEPMSAVQGQIAPPEDPVKAPGAITLGVRRAFTTMLLPLGIAIPVIGFFYWLSKSQFSFQTDTARVTEALTKPLRAPKPLPPPAHRVTAEEKRIEQEIEERRHVLSVRKRRDTERQAAEAQKQADKRAASERAKAASAAKKQKQSEAGRHTPAVRLVDTEETG